MFYVQYIAIMWFVKAQDKKKHLKLLRTSEDKFHLGRRFKSLWFRDEQNKKTRKVAGRHKNICRLFFFFTLLKYFLDAECKCNMAKINKCLEGQRSTQIPSSA